MKGIIFDMDGTMIDNMMVHHRAWKRKLNALGMEISLEEVRQKIHGVNEEIIAKLFGDRFTPEERKQIAEEKEIEYRKIFLPELKLIDGLPEFLNEIQLSGIPVGIGTAAPPGNVNFVMDNLGLWDMFKAVKHSKDVTKGKPDPEIFQLVASEIGVPIEDCVIFEDTPTGVEAAYNAGCPAIVVTTTHTEDEFKKYPNVRRFIPDYREMKLSDLI